MEVALSDCPECWDTPCTCSKGHLGSKIYDYTKLKAENAELKRQLDQVKKDWSADAIMKTNRIVSLEKELEQLKKLHTIECPFPDCKREFWHDLTGRDPYKGTFYVKSDKPKPPKYSELEQKVQSLEIIIKNISFAAHQLGRMVECRCDGVRMCGACMLALEIDVEVDKSGVHDE